MTNHAMHTLLTNQFSPSVLLLDNESHQHAGYFEGKQSHFRLVIVSNHFEGISAVARHRLIYSCIGKLLTSSGGSVHALAIHAYTPSEWATQQHTPTSPACQGNRH